MNLGRTGFTTGTCAAAAAKAAAMALCGQSAPREVEVALPEGARVTLPVHSARLTETGAEAAVRKDAGDDPDITHQTLVVASVAWSNQSPIPNLQSPISFKAGPGVGTVTKPGLSVPVGEPAINPVPRQMIAAAIRAITPRAVTVTVSIPGGEKLAEKTFNPRLGVAGGLSILGTTGRVRPFSAKALRDSLKCTLDVARACGVRAPVFVPGHIGERAARKHLRLTQTEQLVEVSNEWGFMLDRAAEMDFAKLLVVGHAGKLAKLPAGEWQTHSSNSPSAVPFVGALCRDILGRNAAESPTVEGLFDALNPDEREHLAQALAARIAEAVALRMERRLPVAVGLVNMQSEWLGDAGDLSPWR